MTRKEYDDKIAALSVQLLEAQQRSAKWQARYEEAAKWQGLWKSKYERLVATNKRSGQSQGGTFQERAEAARERARASGEPASV